MTAWQDQPPLSRRQVRQNERSGSAEGQLDVDSARPREGWDVDARRPAAPEIPASDDSVADGTSSAQSTDAPVTRAPVAGGRRAQRAVGPASVEPASDLEADASGEPLIYATQGRLPQPSNSDGQQSRRRSVSAVPEATDAAAEQTPYRVRDFSPETRPRVTAPETEEWAPPTTPSDLDYRTQGAPFPAPSAATPVVMPPIVPIDSAPVAPAAPVVSAAPEERTMTRRELRAREQRALQEQGLAGAPVPSEPAPAPAAQAPTAPAPTTPAPTTQTPASAAPGFDDLLAPASDAPVRADMVETAPPPALVDPLVRPLVVPAAPETQTPGESLSLLDGVEEQTPAAPLRLRDRFRRQAAPVDEIAPDVDVLDDDVPEDEVIVAEIVEPVVETPAPEAPRAPAPAEPAAVSEPSTDTGSFVPPVGHWSTQATIDDDEQFQQQPLARNIGATSGAITTNALVIPSLPSEELLRPLGATGEILITGSIDLPRSMGATGAHPARYDHSDVDALLDADDREDAHPESAPVRAIRAVSTHTSTRGVMDARKPKGNSRLPIILGVTGAVLVVGIVALVVAGMIFKIF